MTREMGKPLRESRLEAARAAQILRFFAGEGWRPVGQMYEQSLTGATVYTRRRPLGVVGLITPWNFPAAIPAWKTAPALAYGNTVVLKLAQDSPLTGLHLARALEEAGASRTASSTSSSVAAARSASRWSSDPRVPAISFTGSVPVGHGVRDRAASLGKRVQLELGGHNPLIVAEDAKLDAAVEAAYVGAFWSAGQKCTATRRIYVQDARLRRVPRAAADADRRGQGRRPGRSRRPRSGRSSTRRSSRSVLAGIERGRDEGGTVLAGGERADPDAYLIAPTRVRERRRRRLPVVRGGVRSGHLAVPLRHARRGDRARERGRASACRRRCSPRAWPPRTRCVDELQAGIIHVNSQTAGADVHVPFGGIKELRLRPARAGPRGDRVLHRGGHRLPGRLSSPDGYHGVSPGRGHGDRRGHVVDGGMTAR